MSKSDIASYPIDSSPQDKRPRLLEPEVQRGIGKETKSEGSEPTFNCLSNKRAHKMRKDLDTSNAPRPPIMRLPQGPPPPPRPPPDNAASSGSADPEGAMAVTVTAQRQVPNRGQRELPAVALSRKSRPLSLPLWSLVLEMCSRQRSPLCPAF